ncbi:MAG: undecaprenyldiphospho-muramoylpentapeptide beta-N-acetylglucosaminyltransferase [Bacteroidetes bacterium]|nr:undecaprenyldiphospho-muramoylpentapeptide beta-N-acetylglucosaminyltransferase [Rhodothermia bacterium]MCX7906031.1 undecaprenyldiphospho-muramoylpentapeptide beta-N-acetylglucosaminyltransferase [Bacteroidota bacterium]MDW8285843.1 undecaprenyldiphospho-muramoylpentapeptide beta-N-acetylglucosaminyltransferase [Bacteroidota bacterium]
MRAPPGVLFVGGGTGGHVYPALAVAEALRRLKPEVEIAFAGTPERLEGRVVPQAGYPFYAIPARGLRRRQWWRNLSLPVVVGRGLGRAWRLLDRIRPYAIVATGGYVTVPVLSAAVLRGLPYVLQEQNSYPGLANRCFARWARWVCLGFEAAAAYFPQTRVRLTGNPVRSEIGTVPRALAAGRWGFSPDRFTVLALGGSLGAETLNRAMARWASTFLEAGWQVLWQTGPGAYGRLRSQLPPHPRLYLSPFLEAMAEAYGAADVVVCRAGALTLSELAQAGLPSVLVPSPNVVADHQRRNAELFAQAGAAVLLPDQQAEAQLGYLLQELAAQPERRIRMGVQARQLSRPGAAETIARLVWELIEAQL